MAIPVKADIIYYRTPSDFELEFNLSGCCTMRLLSDRPQNEKDLLRSLSRAVSRSQIIFTVGSLEGEGSIIDDVCSAIGYSEVERDLSPFGLNQSVMLPSGSIPLISSDSRFGGCVIECGPQAIIVLTDDRELRKTIMRELIHEYVKDLGKGSRREQSIESPPAANNESLTATEETTPEIVTQTFSDIDNVRPESKPQGNASDPFVLKAEELPEPNFDNLENELFEEHKGKKRKAGKRIITCFFVLLFVAVAAVSYILFAEPLIIDKLYSDYRNMLGDSGEYTDPEMLSSFGMLYDQNRDTVGFVEINNTEISYPVVSAAEREDGYYRHRLFNGWLSPLYGTPYTESYVASDAFLRNTVIHGKATLSGRMFSDLERIATLEGYRSSPTVVFDTIYSEGTYKIFAAFTYSGEVPNELLKTEFFDDEEFQEHIEKLLSASAILTTVDINSGDEIITLVSHSRDGGAVVAARKVRANESELVDTQNAKPSSGSGTITNNESSGNDGIVAKRTEIRHFSEYASRFEQYLAPTPYEPIAVSSETPSAYSSMQSSSSADSSSGEEQTSSVPENVPGEEILTVTNAATGLTETGSAADILARIVEYEMGADFEAEALKAQTVATYGWLISSGATARNAPTVSMKTASAKTTEAVKSVLGLKPYYDGQLAQTYYTKCSAGYTADSNSIWAIKLPYLVSAESSFDRNADGYLSRRTYSADDVKRWVFESTGIDLSKTSDKSKWFNVIYDRNGLYAEAVRFGNDSEYYSGRFLRDSVFTVSRTGADNTLLSTAYRISYHSASDCFNFEVRGSGHGVGMSQNGANVLAKKGLNYSEILLYYYKGITLDY